MKSSRSLSLFTAAAIVSSSFTVSVFSVSAAEPVVLLSQPMDSEETVQTVIDEGKYEAMVADSQGNEANITLSYVNAGAKYPCLNMTDNNGRYNSAGLKYDITDLTAGKEGSLTITADLSAGYNTVTAAKIGFMSDNGSVLSCENTEIASGEFATVTYTAESVPTYNEKLYFFATTAKPTLRIRNLTLTLASNSEATPAATEGTAEATPEPADKKTAPGVLLDHPMSTETEVNEAAGGYVNLVSTVTARSASFDSSKQAMNYTNSGTYASQGFKYDITELAKQAIEEYGSDAKFRLSMDIMGTVGTNYTPSIGFVKGSNTDNARSGGNVIAKTELSAAGVNNEGFTTVTCTSKLTADDTLSFYLYSGQPTVYVKNISVKYPVEDEPDPTLSPTDKPNAEPEQPKKFNVTAPTLDEDGAAAYITVTNTTEADKSFGIYTASYDEKGVLKTVKVTPAAAAAGETDKKITFDAAAKV